MFVGNKLNLIRALTTKASLTRIPKLVWLGVATNEFCDGQSGTDPLDTLQE